MRFSETTLVRTDRVLRLLDASGGVLLELKGHEIEDAVRAGFVDLNNCHYSMFEYAQMRRTLQPITATPSRSRGDGFDAMFLSRYNIRWD